MDKLVKNKENNKGFLTIELMISLGIITMILSAVVVVSFTNQNFLVDSQTNSEALKIAQGLLEEQQALARKDFNLVNPVPYSPDIIIDENGCPSVSTTYNNFYNKKICVKTNDFNLNKLVTVIISWNNNGKSLKLNSLIANFNDVAGGNTCSSVLIGDWSNPDVINGQTNFAKLIEDSSNIYTLSDLDVYKNKLYITASKAKDPNDINNKTLSTLFIFDVSNKKDPILKGQLDNASNTILGLNNVHVSEDLTSIPQEIYAYATNAYNCDPLSLDCDGQFYIINVTDPESLNINSGVSGVKVLSSPAITKTNGTSIFYKNNYIFLGLAKNDGPEFQMIDVHNPDEIVSGYRQAISNFEDEKDINDNGINDIYVKNNYVYLASTSQNDKKLEILDISNPGDIISVNHFDVGPERGKSLFLAGDRLYFGKSKSMFNDYNFYIFNIQDLGNTLKEIGKIKTLSSSINDIIVRSNLGFFLTNSTLEIFDIGNPLDTNPITIDGPLVSLSLPTSSTSPIPEPSMDCEDNYLYIVSNDNSGNGYLSIITSPEI